MNPPVLSSKDRRSHLAPTSPVPPLSNLEYSLAAVKFWTKQKKGFAAFPQAYNSAARMALKSILITGCSEGGVGAALTAALAKRGHHIFATARTPSKIPQDIASLSNVTTLPLDVTSASSVAEAVKAVADSGHGLDVLINNAGAGYATPVLDIDIEKAKQLYDTNIWGPIRMVQAFADLLVSRRGRVVNVGSCASVLACPWIGPCSLLHPE